MSLGKQLARIFEFKILSDYTVWSTTTSYVINDVVENDSSYYVCIQEHTSTTEDEPGTGVNWEDYWELLDDEYLHISGINSFSPSQEKNDADTTDFDSQGWMEHIVASRGVSFDVEGYHIEDEETGLRDAGQERIEEIGQLVANESITGLRLINPSGENVDFDVSIDAPQFGQSTGGGNDDPAGWSCTMTVTGDPTIS